MAYTSQQDAFLQQMVSYLQNPDNWASGVPKLTDFTPGSIIYTLLSAVAVAGDTLAYSYYLVKLAARIISATGTDLDDIAADYGLTRKPALAAMGTFHFTKKTTASQNTLIVAGSLVSTIPDSSGTVVVFATNQDTNLLQGQSAVDVLSTCQQTGIIGNLAANTQLVISSPVPGIDGVSLMVNISNGVEVETDDSLRARIFNALQAIARGTVAWYQETALAIPGVASVKVIPQNRGVGTVDVMITGPGNTIPSADIQSQVQAAITSGKIITDDALEQVPSVVVITSSTNISVLSGFDPAAVCLAVQSAQIAFVNGLGPGANNIGYVYNAALNAVAMGVLGVANAVTTFVDTPILPNQMPQTSTNQITVTSS